MLAAYTETEKQNSFTLIGANSLLGSARVSEKAPSISLLETPTATNGLDVCSFYSGPSDATIAAFCESAEGMSTVAYSNSESCGSIAYAAGSESCGSIASASVSSSSGCSYSC